MHRPMIVSEAGCAGHAPENTLASIQVALDLRSDGIEIDVRVTADLVPVLLHGETVVRANGDTTNLNRLTLSEVRAAAGPDGESIPTLAEVLDVTRGRALLVIESKEAGIEHAILRDVRALDAVRDCEFHSFIPEAVGALRQAEPRMAAALLTFGKEVDDWPALFDRALSLGAQGVSIHGAFARPVVVSMAQRRSLTATAWMVDEERHIRAALAAGVDRICTSFPDRARDLIDAQPE